MSDTDLFKLYSQQILTLAASIPHAQLLPSFDGQARERAPLCGSTVEVTLRRDHGRITAFGQKVQACALGQASASIFGAQVIGCGRDEIARLCAELDAMLAGGPVPAAPFGGYDVLQAARAYPNRHASILLAPRATLAALV
ncbi:iron-sulfur cluster assembly scaffold protein [Paenirhodobacter sp.]|uniref:iron-sulfur cluster assembly scaffold protein n=1 Tax=Paenirhodobacter sp. TaxID=1965326 RepID=UPI003B41DAA9